MPLTGTGGIGLPNDRRRAIGFWMTNKARPIEPVRVFVTYEALRQLDPTHPQDVPAAIGIFDANRTKIEAADRSHPSNSQITGKILGISHILTLRSDFEA